MKNLTLTGAFIRNATLATSQKDGAKTVRINFTMAWTKTVRENLDWSELSDDQNTVSLDGELAIHEMKMDAGGYVYDFQSGMLSGFNVVRVQEQDKSRLELRCQYTCMGKGIAGEAEQNIEKCGRVKGSMKIKYERSEAGDNSGGEDQPKLPGTDTD